MPRRTVRAARAAAAPYLQRLYRADLPIASKLARRSLIRSVYGNDLVPIEQLGDSFGEAIDWLLTQRSSALNGLYLEFGVCSGSSMIALRRALDSRPEASLEFVGFDSFEGLPDDAPQQDDGVWDAGAFISDRTRTEERLRNHGVEPRIVEGWFSDTLNDATRRELGPRSAPLIMIDCDVYSAAAEALEFCYPFLTGPTVIVFDDWHTGDLASKNLGEARAWAEFLQRHCDIVEVRTFPPYNDNSHIVGVDRRLDSADSPDAQNRTRP